MTSVPSSSAVPIAPGGCRRPTGRSSSRAQYLESVAEDVVDDLDERRRIGLEMQARLPKSKLRPKQKPVIDGALDGADLGFSLADFGRTSSHTIGLRFARGTSAYAFTFG